MGVIFYLSKNNNLVSESVPKNNLLTMMLETDVDSNQYEVASNNNWPQEGYSFNQELSYCEQGSTLLWNEESKSISLKTSVTDKCYVYFDKEPEIIYLADYIKNTVYTGVDGENGLYYHDGVGTYTNADQEAGDNSYRYSGADPANYVCFGSYEEVCLEDNLYRIIGVFGSNVKLIKSTSYGTYAWDSGNNNTWNLSIKPDIYTILNTIYYSTLGSEWQNLIANFSWQVGGMVANVTNTAKQYYDVEVGTGQNGYAETMNIGLMYISDLAFAVIPENWTLGVNLSISNYELTYNWLYLNNENINGIYEWTISRYSDISNNAFFINHFFYSDGTPEVMQKITLASECIIRPSFYLKPEVQLIGGNGSKENPFRLAL